MAFYAPNRVLVHGAQIWLRVIQISSGVYVPFTETDLLSSAYIFGPAKNIEITNPRNKIARTAIGDAGDHNLPGRRGTWTVSIEALLDATSSTDTLVTGDGKIGSIIDKVVDFAIAYEQAEGLIGFDPFRDGTAGLSPLWLVKGTGHLDMRVLLPAGEGASMARDVTITRAFGSGKYGNLVWANPVTGAFPDPSTLPIPLQPLPLLPA